MMKSTYVPPLSFQELAHKLSKPGEEIIAQLDPGKCHMLHMALGAAGEVGELADCIKKHVLYGKALDRANLVEEIADVRFFLAGLMNAEGIGESEISQEINRKLGKRYASGGYSNAEAQARADKGGAETITEPEASK